MNVRRFVIALVVLTACVQSPDGGRGRVRGPTTDADGDPVLPVTVVVATGDPGLARTYLDGMRLAARELNRGGGVAEARLALDVSDDRATIRGALSRGVATLVVGPGSDVADVRHLVERDGDPLLLLGGDLYSSRGMFRQVFQVTPPLAWQAEPLARYLVHDRGYERVALVADGSFDGDVAADVMDAAMQEEGAELHDAVVLRRPPAPVVAPRQGSDAVVVAGTSQLVEGVGDVHRAPTTPRLGSFASGLSASGLPPGTVATYPYTWAVWADPIPRVRAFRERFARAFGREPTGFEQEGYDAVRVLADALERTGGRGGPGLIRALEGTSGATYSSLPVTLGPDDHLLATRGQIGIFVRLAPEEIDQRVSPTGAPWAPLMRTFTYNGLRTSVVDDDKRVFFPAWRKKAPAPPYPRARYGITTGPDDPLR